MQFFCQNLRFFSFEKFSLKNKDLIQNSASFIRKQISLALIQAQVQQNRLIFRGVISTERGQGRDFQEQRAKFAFDFHLDCV